MKRALIIVGVLVVLLGGTWALLRKGTDTAEIEFRYAPVVEGDLVRSTSANGLLVALTTVDVRSKAGGKVVKLAVDEGTEVKAGDLIAEIDPADTRAVYDQAAADVQSAEARAESARINEDLQVRNSANAVSEAKVAQALAQIRLSKAETDAKTQPMLTDADLASARASLNAQEQSLRQLQTVTSPQSVKDANSNFSRAAAELKAAEAEATRQSELLKKGFVSQAAVDRATSALESARSAYEIAAQRRSTIQADQASLLESQRSRVASARATLAQADANRSRVVITKKSLEEALGNLEQAKLGLENAQDALLNVRIRRSDVRGALASTVRSRVSFDNAKVQLDSTTVTAPRDGVITLKYIEEGTIIPPGASTFSQGTAIVQISDTTRMYVECAVDEADVAQVTIGQNVQINLEAYPGTRIAGKVSRVNPSAKTENSITAVKVRIEVLPGAKVKLLPGMTATCEFVTMSLPKVLIAPSQAIQREEGKTYVRVKSTDPKKPERREVTLGESGNDGVQILTGLKVGEEVVVAEINLAQMRDVQQRMLDAQQGGGLAGGAPARPGGPGAPMGGGRPGGGGGMGGGRPSGGGR